MCVCIYTYCKNMLMNHISPHDPEESDAALPEPLLKLHSEQQFSVDKRPGHFTKALPTPRRADSYRRAGQCPLPASGRRESRLTQLLHNPPYFHIQDGAVRPSGGGSGQGPATRGAFCHSHGTPRLEKGAPKCPREPASRAGKRGEGKRRGPEQSPP